MPISRLRQITVLLFVISFLAACGQQQGDGAAPAVPSATNETLVAALSPAEIAPGEKMRVAATTTLVGDAVARIGGDLIDLTVLLPPGSDPHAYVASPQDLVALADAQVVFINGLGLEESLLPALGRVEQGPIVSVNEAVTPLESVTGEEDEHANDEHANDEDAEGEHADEHEHGAYDPHTWQDVRNVAQWAITIGDALARLDPVHANAYRQAADDYRTELAMLHTEVAATIDRLPPERRLLVTDHEDLDYFAAAYGMEVVGAVTPSFSTTATISAQQMAALQDQIETLGIPAIFVDSTANPRLAGQVAQDTGVRVVTLYSGSLSAPDGPAPTYMAMMRTNAQTIAAALE
jgi:ABC-type Zn uptake system ZnuABC Zn-binding protein ZnuA